MHPGVAPLPGADRDRTVILPTRAAAAPRWTGILTTRTPATPHQFSVRSDRNAAARHQVAIPAAGNAAAPPSAGRRSSVGNPSPQRREDVRPRRAGLGPLVGVLLLAGPALLAGCGADDPAPAATTPAPATTKPTQPREQLAALAAAAQDRQMTAVYTLTVSGQPNRSISVFRAADRSWRVDIPAGALGGTADVSLVQNGAGLFQCALPSAGYPESAGCVRVADPGQPLDPGIDPRMRHPFTDWPEVLTDRRAPLSVATAELPGAQGSCFAVESTSASVGPPLDPGIYCFAADGTLTAARLPAGTLTLAGTPAAAPATVALPGPVVVREPLRIAGPPGGSTDDGQPGGGEQTGGGSTDSSSSDDSSSDGGAETSPGGTGG
ncbi:hypothetical protein [Plantactinospora endophytica]|uniref:Lipoprotein n=1 Tax=Plantactinospora endophytica TaxID=673535 RepID=A0ABQ4DSV9_9ACTN|nr:hypothetical protein [Plantactinospora endophytica]GIG85156.1 hypothetical protein Pen02_00920 [Plantactinospora endophytica]